jgi:hypothetical protein
MTRSRSLRRTATLTLAALVAIAPAARAQDQKLSEILPDLYIRAAATKAVAVSEVFGTPLGPTVDFVVDQVFDQLLPVFQINNLIGVQASSFPLGSSAGGFSFTVLDPVAGTFSRNSASFGPVFADRALTTGRGRLNVGVNYQRATFDSLEGLDLESGETTTYTRFVIGLTPTVAVPVVFEDQLRLKLSMDTVGLFANYGLTDKVDVGVAVPIVRVRMESSLDTRVAVGSQNFGNVITGSPVSGEASGIGDIVIRGKYNFLARTGGGLAALVDWRLPTGDEEDFLGVGGSQLKLQLAGSTAVGRIAPHVNVGFTISGESDAAASPDTFILAPPNEFNFAGGVDIAVHDRMTVVGDIVGRHFRDTPRLELAPTSFNPNLQQLTLGDSNLNNLLGSAGIKFNPMGPSLITFNVLFPLNDAGLTDKLSWVGGMEFSF